MEKKTNLTESEWKVMEKLWESAPMTITQLVNAVKDETGWAKATVITMLNRMEAKGAVYYNAGEKARLYYPAVARNEVAAQETEHFIDRVYNGSVGLLINSLVDNKQFSEAEIDELYAILKKAEEEL